MDHSGDNPDAGPSELFMDHPESQATRPRAHFFSMRPQEVALFLHRINQKKLGEASLLDVLDPFFRSGSQNSKLKSLASSP